VARIVHPVYGVRSGWRDSMVDVLNLRLPAALATVNEDASIHLTPVWVSL